MASLADFEKLRDDLVLHVDVLIQHSENYYVMCREAETRRDGQGGKTFELMRRAVGHEIVARLYRLIESIPNGNHFSLLIEYLADDDLLNQMMPKFNHDGSKSLNDLKVIRDEILQTFDIVRTSDQFARTEIYRHRFVGHRLPQPGKLKKLPPTADVTSLSSAELRWLTDSIAEILNKVAYMYDRGEFPANDIARMAEYDAHEFWGLEPPKGTDVIEYLTGKH